jgi:two-component system cell cycle sensor histidine kinase/response regulator CckA
MTAPESGGLGPSAYREIFEGLNEAIFVHDLAGRILLVNARTCAMYECSRQEALRLSIADFSLNEAPYSQREAVAYIDRAIAEGECSFEWRSRRRSGVLFWTEVALRAFDLDGRPHIMASVRDIDARKHFQASLRQSEERFAKIFNATSTMLAFTERAHGRIIDVNQAWLAATGARREDVIGKTGTELGLWAEAADRERIIEALDASGRVHEVEAELVMGGRALPARISVEYIEMHGERYLLWELGDLSERKRAERDQEQLRTQLLQAQKMESIGQLAGGIAHDFNNILSTILGFGDLVLARLPAESKESKYVAEIVRAGERASELTKQILAFSRKQVMQPRVVDPVEVLRGMEAMLGRLIGENIALELALAPATSPIRVDVSHLEQAIMNLVVNAHDAMPEGGTLTLETANVDFDGSYASTHADALPGPHVMIAVSDTGVGMDAATRARAFEPFFTTKGPARGTGLGLSTVYGIVKQSGGWVWLYSEPGRGTTFKLYFPRSGEALEPTAETTGPHVRPRADTIVLMVEDDPQVRLLVATILGGAGYTVLVAADPREALEMSERYAGEIDLLLTDVVMPFMSGRQLADKIMAARPGTRVMYVSGYTENTIVHHGEVDEGVSFLSKPITSSRLLGMVARVLARAPHGGRP